MSYLIEQGGFVLRFRYWAVLLSLLRKTRYTLLGMKIGGGTTIPKLYTTWPNQVAIGKNCTLEPNIYFKFDGIWQSGPSIHIGNHVFLGTGCEFNISLGITIGDNSLIASGCRFIDHDHGMLLGLPMRTQPSTQKAIQLGNDVWLGCNVVVLKGVKIGDGAIVAAGAIVTKSILPNEIWAGVPARKIGQRNS
jgi:acetyltransferase-like isoleucine patch superfamily enzyme